MKLISGHVLNLSQRFSGLGVPTEDAEIGHK